MTVNASDVQRLVGSSDSEAALVLIEGRVEVVTPDQLASPEYQGALQISTRGELVARAGDAQPSERQLAELAEDLDTAVRNLGG
ncbi:hypothetical protein A5714_10270 [Mycobacterium sp. E2462]|uniref:hypothetical protein n=1 Tax=Mycobacterium sp. E2462 TaxID=1834133 RepID=UPI0007FCDBD7|nr:hypothetical protein [Mycobacterium sp. E2462]OBI17593.1 hypothetical protein A5714_10270 [Mycobacterium sp. E2462]